MTDTFTHIGRSRRLKDGSEKVTGMLEYAPDVALRGAPGGVYARFVTSPHPHARVTAIDTSMALDVPGVVAVLTADDFPAITPTSRHRLLLARDRVLFVGQPVALVLATDEAAAEDGAELVRVEYERLPAAVTMDQARAADAPLVWPEGMPGESEEAAAHGAEVEGEADEAGAASNVAVEVNFSRGDVEAGFAAADTVVEHVFTTSMVHQSYLEPHATIAAPNAATGGVTIWTSTQAPFYVREQVAEVLGVPESDVRVIATPVGGGFGGKFLLYEPLVALAAVTVKRPVRLVLTRSEEMLAGNPAPAARIRVKLGATRDGTFTALDAELTFDGGCYPSSPVGIASLLLGSYYQVPALRIRGTEVLTFKPSSGAYRAPGMPQATFALESTVDTLAKKLDVDPLTLRLRNASAPGDPMASEKPWGHMGMRQVLEALRDHPAWRQRNGPTEDAGTRRGVGIAIGGWPGGTEPAAAACMLNRDGTLHVHVGSVDLTGTTTGFAMLAAEAFGLSPDQVRVMSDDTDSAPYAGAAGGSKITYTVGPAIIQAAREAREQTIAITAEELEVAPEDLEIVDGTIRVRGAPDRAITLADVADRTMQFGGRHAPVFGRGRHADTTTSPAFCAQLADVAVDVETGAVSVERLVVVQDVGRALNPAAVAGQMIGGATQGLGWALHEQLRYDENGQLLTGSWMDYTVPHSTHSASQIETVIVEVPAEHGPFGARGVGEPPVIATAAAVGNAIADATGVRLRELPMTTERIIRLRNK